MNHLKSADHASKLSQLDAEGKPPPDPIYTIAKMGADFTNLTGSTVLPTSVTTSGGVGTFSGPIDMEMTDDNGTTSVQVVVSGDNTLETCGFTNFFENLKKFVK